MTALLSSLEIDNHALARGHIAGRHSELEQYWNEPQILTPGPHTGDGWADEFAQRRVGQQDPNAWALSFERQHGAGGWASEFEHVRMLFKSLVPYVDSSCLTIIINFM